MSCYVYIWESKIEYIEALRPEDSIDLLFLGSSCMQKIWENRFFF